MKNEVTNETRGSEELPPASGSKWVTSIVTTRDNGDGTMRIQNNVIVESANSQEEARGKAVGQMDLVGEKLQIFSVIVIGPDQLT